MWCMSPLRWSCQSPASHSCSFLNHPNSFCRGMFKLIEQFDADSLLCLLSHFECDSLTVHVLTQLESTILSDYYSEVIIVHTCAFQSTPFGCQVTWMSHKQFSLYKQRLDIFQTDLLFFYLYTSFVWLPKSSQLLYCLSVRFISMELFDILKYSNNISTLVKCKLIIIALFHLFH